MSDTDRDTLVIDPNNVIGSGQDHERVSITPEEQLIAIEKMGQMIDMLTGMGRTRVSIMKSMYLNVIATIINIGLLASAADARAFIESLVLPELENLAKFEPELRADVEAKMAAEEAANATKH